MLGLCKIDLVDRVEGVLYMLNYRKTLLGKVGEDPIPNLPKEVESGRTLNLKAKPLH